MKLRNEKNRYGFGEGTRLVSLVAGAAAVCLVAIVVLVGAASDTVQQPNRGMDIQAAWSAPQKDPAVKPRPGHSDYLRGLTRRALGEGFGKDDVLLLAPQPGPGRDAVAKKMLALASAKTGRFGRRLSGTGLKPARPDNNSVTFIGPRSYLKVSDDGTKLVFRGNIDDQAEIQRARSAGRLLEKDELEKLGRTFIKDALGDFVSVGAEESVTFLGVRYLRDGSFTDKGRADEEVVANIAIFGREIRGVPVIGSGSKIAVWFANDRQPVGFDVDWPAYKVLGSKQKVLSRSRLNERVGTTTVPVTGSPRAEVARFECGYVDLGSSKRGSQIQSGCAIHYAGRNDDGSMWARVEYVPAGEKVIADPKWPLSGLIAGGRTINTGTPEFVKYASTKPPARDDGSPDK